MSQLVKAPPRALARPLAPVASAAEARRELTAARERLTQRLEVVEARVTAAVGSLEWRAVVRRYPYACAGGALLVGFALGRLFSRK